jgi:Protein of unknown function (DUF732)
MNRRTVKTWAAVAALGALAGCGGTAANHPAAPRVSQSHSAQAPAGAERFLAAVRAAGLGAKDVAGTPDWKIMRVGRAACDGFATGISYGGEIEAFIHNSAGISTHQAAVLVRAAARNLCPEYTSLLPAGAP